MKKFAILLLKIAAIFVGLNLVSIPLFHQSGNSRFLPYIKPFLDLEDHYDVVVFGDSHADDVWRTNTSAKILNAAAGSDNQEDIARKIAYLRTRGVKIDKVLYEIDRSQVTTSREKLNNNDISRCMTNDAPIWLAYSLPLVFNPKIKTELQNAFTDLFRIDNPSANGPHKIDTAEMKERATQQFFNAAFSDNMFGAMKENLQTLQNSGVEVVLISYPLYDGYRKLIDTSNAYRQAERVTKTFVASSRLPELDYLDALCKKDNFANQDHVHIPYSSRLTSHILDNLATGSNIKAECIDRADTVGLANP